MTHRPTPELSACIGTRADFAGTDLSAFDAVYLGQPYCLLREGSLLVDTAALAGAIAELKAAGKKAYLTTPVVPTTDEMIVVREAVETAVEAGIDGIEAHDMGVFGMLRAEFPRVPVHIGHFANVYHAGTAQVFADLGAARVMPSYELTLDEKISFLDVAAHSGFELSVPVAGKIPVGMAHACLLRLDQATWTEGPCHQQCAERRELSFSSDEWRMRSAGTAMLMAEDLSMLVHLSRLRDLGFTALRMETWMEGPAKISTLGRLYRSVLEAATEADTAPEKAGALASSYLIAADAEAALAEGGLCNGWYFGASGRDYVDEVEKAYADFVSSAGDGA